MVLGTMDVHLTLPFSGALCVRCGSCLNRIHLNLLVAVCPYWRAPMKASSAGSLSTFYMVCRRGLL